jgi:hypothetical protein
MGPKALEEAANSTMGLPFVIQLIGYHAFNQSQRKTISLVDVQAGIRDANIEPLNRSLEDEFIRLIARAEQEEARE